MEEKLRVPENIALRWEAWRGVGKAELVAILLVTALTGFLAFVVCTITASKIRAMGTVFSAVCAAAIASGVFTKLDGSQSVYDILRRQGRYRKEQQTFYYVREEREVHILEEKTG